MLYQLMDNQWIHFATNTDTVTTFWGEVDLVETLHANFYHFVIVTSQLYFNECCNVKRKSFTDTKLHQGDCCEKLGLKNNVGQLWGDVKCKKTAPRLDDLKYVVSKLSSVDRKIHNTNVQTTRQSNTAHILSHYLHFIT